MGPQPLDAMLQRLMLLDEWLNFTSDFGHEKSKANIGRAPRVVTVHLEWTLPSSSVSANQVCLWTSSKRRFVFPA